MAARDACGRTSSYCRIIGSMNCQTRHTFVLTSQCTSENLQFNNVSFTANLFRRILHNRRTRHHNNGNCQKMREFIKVFVSVNSR